MLRDEASPFTPSSVESLQVIDRDHVGQDLATKYTDPLLGNNLDGKDLNVNKTFVEQLESTSSQEIHANNALDTASTRTKSPETIIFDEIINNITQTIDEFVTRHDITFASHTRRVKFHKQPDMYRYNRS
jgi:hypothetical protein